MKNENVDDYFDEFAEHTISGVLVIVDAPDTDFFAGAEAITAQDVQILYATKRLNLKGGEEVTLVNIDTGIGVVHKVRAVRAIEDGAVTRAGLVKK